uniref:ankyrin repeat domain-containing protein 34B isoform X1 n=1 Tax=Doryrhamphus excisus TaxID=161450 RepID=UPI0025ADB287|nr:ankyrin repeat domain-containing protein 34B isoform X1 [Doryrhamphus excisus]XP_057946283.1 ankyrin repeat domain-containing protein 34B isoform X1 [Doryrhamphus excisus]
MTDTSSLISAAASGKLRLVRLLVEGGAQVDGCDSREETALLATCKALRGEPPGPEAMKIITYLLQNRADPNARDQEGRTALMYACMERARAQVASLLLSAGADPSMVDHSGASALVYAVNTQDEPTLKVLMDACRAKGREIIIIATEVSSGAECPSYPDILSPLDTSSSVSCMSPSDIVLKMGSPNSSESENIFSFKGTVLPFDWLGSIIKPPSGGLRWPPVASTQAGNDVLRAVAEHSQSGPSHQSLRGRPEVEEPAQGERRRGCTSLPKPQEHSTL